MNPTLRKDADAIIASSLNAVLPDEAFADNQYDVLRTKLSAAH